MQLLLELGANVNIQDYDLWTPLHIAAACGHMTIAETLLEVHEHAYAKSCIRVMLKTLGEPRDKLIIIMATIIVCMYCCQSKIDLALMELAH